MNSRLRSTLFLMEQLIVIAVFAVCAAVCVNIFAGSFIMANNSKDMKNALLIAESGAECYKSTAGDTTKAAVILSGSVRAYNDGPIPVYYDEKCRVCEEGEAAYVLYLTDQNPEETFASTVFCNISVEKITGDEIISFDVAARRKTV